MLSKDIAIILLQYKTDIENIYYKKLKLIEFLEKRLIEIDDEEEKEIIRQLISFFSNTLKD